MNCDQILVVIDSV